MSETQISKQRTIELEEEIGALLDAKITDGNAGKNHQIGCFLLERYIEQLSIACRKTKTK